MAVTSTRDMIAARRGALAPQVAVGTPYAASPAAPPPSAPPSTGTVSGEVQGQTNVTPLYTQPASPARAVIGDPNAAALAAAERTRQATLTGYDASARAIGASGQVLDATGRVIDTEMATLPVRQAGIAADRGEVAARRAQIGSEAALIGMEQQQNAASVADLQAIRAARANVGDKIAVGREALQRGATDARDRAFGIAPPVEIAVPPGSNAALPGWARATLQTQEEIKTGQAKQNEDDRAIQMRQAELAVKLQSQDVTRAELAAREAGLTLEEANLMVDSARREQDRAQLGSSRAGLDERTASLNERRAALDERYADKPPFAGAEKYTDPTTGVTQWVTPAVAEQRRHDFDLARSRARIGEGVVTQEERNRIENERSRLGGITVAEGLALLANYRTNPGGYPAGFREKLEEEMVRQGISREAARQRIDDAMHRGTTGTVITGGPAFGR